MAKIVMNHPGLTPSLKEDIIRQTFMVDVEISSYRLWKELLKEGFSPEKWSENNHGNKIYLAKQKLYPKRKIKWQVQEI